MIHDALEDVMKEIAVMKKLDHPNVIRLHEVLYAEEKGKLYLSKFNSHKTYYILDNIHIFDIDNTYLYIKHIAY